MWQSAKSARATSLAQSALVSTFLTAICLAMTRGSPTASLSVVALSEINTLHLFACHRFALFVARAFRMLTKRDLFRSATLIAIGAAAAKSGLARDESSTDRPGLLGAKDIAQAGFVYGLPIVMNYGVM